MNVGVFKVKRNLFVFVQKAHFRTLSKIRRVDHEFLGVPKRKRHLCAYAYIEHFRTLYKIRGVDYEFLGVPKRKSHFRACANKEPFRLPKINWCSLDCHMPKLTRTRNPCWRLNSLVSKQAINVSHKCLKRRGGTLLRLAGVSFLHRHFSFIPKRRRTVSSSAKRVFALFS